MNGRNLGQTLRGLREIRASPFTSLNGACSWVTVFGVPFGSSLCSHLRNDCTLPPRHVHPYLLFDLSGASALSQPDLFFFFFHFVFTLPLPQVYFQPGHYAVHLRTEILRQPGLCPQSYVLVSFPDAPSADQPEEQGDSLS